MGHTEGRYLPLRSEARPQPCIDWMVSKQTGASGSPWQTRKVVSTGIGAFRSEIDSQVAVDGCVWSVITHGGGMIVQTVTSIDWPGWQFDGGPPITCSTKALVEAKDGKTCEL